MLYLQERGIKMYRTLGYFGYTNSGLNLGYFGKSMQQGKGKGKSVLPPEGAARREEPYGRAKGSAFDKGKRRGKGPGWAREKLLLEQAHAKEMMKMKLEMARMQRQGASPAAAAAAVSAKHPNIPKALKPTPTDAVKAVSDKNIVAVVKAAERKEKLAKEGGAVSGGGGKTTRELLTGGGPQHKFMRSTDKVGANLHRDDWRKMGAAPPGYDEAKYLARHGDIASAVRAKVMPSGLWHYLKYGKKEGRALAGYRRPGFLAGIFANWDQRD